MLILQCALLHYGIFHIYVTTFVISWQMEKIDTYHLYKLYGQQCCYSVHNRYELYSTSWRSDQYTLLKREGNNTFYDIVHLLYYQRNCLYSIVNRPWILRYNTYLAVSKHIVRWRRDGRPTDVPQVLLLSCKVAFCLAVWQYLTRTSGTHSSPYFNYVSIHSSTHLSVSWNPCLSVTL